MRWQLIRTGATCLDEYCVILYHSIALKELYIYGFVTLKIKQQFEPKIGENPFWQAAPSLTSITIWGDLWSNAYSDPISLKRLEIKLFESYRMVCIWIKYDENWASYLKSKLNYLHRPKQFTERQTSLKVNWPFHSRAITINELNCIHCSVAGE